MQPLRSQTPKLGPWIPLERYLSMWQCSICPFITHILTFMNPLTGDQFKLKHYINCKSTMVVYCLICLICTCPKLYVGQTSQELRTRVQKHLSTIALAERDMKCRKKITPVADHLYWKCTELQMIGLDKLQLSIGGGDPTCVITHRIQVDL